MSTDFWAGYASGAIGILVGNPLDIVKTQLQAGRATHAATGHGREASGSISSATETRGRSWSSFARGAAAPILGYGALNALLFVSYNRSLALLNTGSVSDWPERPPAWSIWAAGAVGGLATFFVSAPTELVKCRAQVSRPPQSSLHVTKDLWKHGGIRGLYLGGGITSIRDAVGYGFYFWSYELSKRALTDSRAGDEASLKHQALTVLLCGGLAGVVTWASVFPLDVIKTRVQTWDLVPPASPASPLPAAAQPLLRGQPESATGRHPLHARRPGTWQIASEAYAREGVYVFFRGLGVCSARAFVVNAVQWAVYEWMMKVFAAH